MGAKFANEYHNEQVKFPGRTHANLLLLSHPFPIWPSRSSSDIVPFAQARREIPAEAFPLWLVSTGADQRGFLSHSPARELAPQFELGGYPAHAGNGPLDTVRLWSILVIR